MNKEKGRGLYGMLFITGVSKLYIFFVMLYYITVIIRRL